MSGRMAALGGWYCWGGQCYEGGNVVRRAVLLFVQCL